MEIIKRWKVIIIAAGVIASAVFYTCQDNADHTKTLLSGAYEETGNGAEGAEAGGRDAEPGGGKPVTGNDEAGTETGVREYDGDLNVSSENAETPEIPPWEQQKEELESLIRRAVREELLKITEEGYLELALLEAAKQAAREAEAKAGMVGLNSAGAEELMGLPGIGRQRAEDILRFREENGGFRNTAEIMQVPGIKEALYNRIKDKIYVD